MVFDIIVLITILVSAVIAFLRGFIREVLTITGVVGGMAAAYSFGPLLSPHMRQWLGVQEGVEPEKLLGILPYTLLAEILAYGSIFLVVVIILSIVSHILAETARSIGLGPVDRTMGVIFGIARGIVLLGLIYLPFHVLLGDEEKKEWFEGSKTFFYVEQTADAMTALLPESTIEKLEQDVKTVQDGVETHETMQKIDLLKDKNGVEKLEQKPASEPANANGYTEEFRDDMDKLFENKPETTESQQ